jgi:hypothetical protein
MKKRYQQILVEIGKKAKIKPLYVFANCPKPIFKEFLSAIKENLGKGVEIIQIYSQKESIYHLFSSQDFFSRKGKIIVLDLELFSPSQSQIYEIQKICQKFNSSTESVVVIHSEKKSINKVILDLASKLESYWWISYETSDIISILKSRFPEIRIMEDAEEVLYQIAQTDLDPEEILHKAALYAFPRKYIVKDDILKVLPLDFSIPFKKVAIDILSGKINSLFLLRYEDPNSVLSGLYPYVFSFIKLKTEAEVYRSLKKFQIEAEFRTSEIDGIIKSMRKVKSSEVSQKFTYTLLKVRVGLFSPLFYLLNFIKDFSKDNFSNE